MRGSSKKHAHEIWPEEGLAEWTSKIRAMQEQVDADEEAEQRSLEKEIAASRLARQRRHHLRTDSLLRAGSLESLSNRNETISADFTQTALATSVNQLSNLRLFDPPTGRPIASFTDRYLKEFEKDNYGKPLSFVDGCTAGASQNKYIPQRSNDEAAQSQLQISSRPNFRRDILVPRVAGAPTCIPEISRRPFILSAPQASTTRRHGAPKDPRLGIRDRTTSTPSLNSSSFGKTRKSKVPLVTEKCSRIRPKNSTISLQCHLSKWSQPSDEVPPCALPLCSESQRFSGPPLQLKSVSNNFLRTPTPREVTPSISRLQGRGFVKSMVKISAQLENSSSPVIKDPGTFGIRRLEFERCQQNQTLEKNTPAPPTTDIRHVVVPDSFVNIDSGTTLSPARIDLVSGLGSATTLHVYKSSPIQTQNIAELDYLADREPAEIRSVPKASLNHPTKQRVRKPRKVKNMNIHDTL